MGKDAKDERKEKAPAEFTAFERLTKGLLVVPKTELDAEMELYNTRKKARRKKPRK